LDYLRESVPSISNLLRPKLTCRFTEWIITATSSPFDESPDVLVEDILNQLRTQADYGVSSSQPSCAAGLKPIIVDYCVGSYERRRKSDETVSIGQAFSHYINRIVSHSSDRFTQ
jgi:hypothetical protein